MVILPDDPKPLGKDINIEVYVYDDFSGEKVSNRLVVMLNISLKLRLSKKRRAIDTSLFVSHSILMHQCCE